MLEIALTLMLLQDAAPKTVAKPKKPPKTGVPRFSGRCGGIQDFAVDSFDPWKGIKTRELT